MNSNSKLSKKSLMLIAPVAALAGALVLSGTHTHAWVKSTLDKSAADARTAMTSEASSQPAQKDACGSGLFVIMAWQCLTSGQNGTGR